MPHCDYCHQTIPAKVHPYTLRLELFPAVEPSVTFNKADLEPDLDAELKRLIEVMEQMDDAQVYKQERLVYLSHSFTLCPSCRHKVAERLDRLFPGKG